MPHLQASGAWDFKHYFRIAETSNIQSRQKSGNIERPIYGKQEHSMFGVGCWMLDVGCSMFDVRCSMFSCQSPFSILHPLSSRSWCLQSPSYQPELQEREGNMQRATAQPGSRPWSWKQTF